MKSLKNSIFFIRTSDLGKIDPPWIERYRSVFRVGSKSLYYITLYCGPAWSWCSDKEGVDKSYVNLKVLKKL